MWVLRGLFHLVPFACGPACKERLLCVERRGRFGWREENWYKLPNLCQVLMWYLILLTLEVGMTLGLVRKQKLGVRFLSTF